MILQRSIGLEYVLVSELICKLNKPLPKHNYNFVLETNAKFLNLPQLKTVVILMISEGFADKGSMCRQNGE